ncbi:MAG TPA: zinc-dependent alcohol dehydrogenase family protein [Kaistia sp.]|nr:zinc-dependent alcohol dehydrogenase family protein [Kaistia sp.]
MKAAIFDGTETLGICELPIQKPGADEVLIRIDSATICGTDIHILEKKFAAKPPVVLGHEFSGYVEQIGSDVRLCRPGDLVSVEPHVYCGCCKPCRLGKPNLCLDRLAWGINRNGGFEQYATVRMDTVYRVPEALGAEQAALGEIVGCCLNGIDRVAVGMGDTVVILGGGAAGVILAKLAERRGAARIIFSEPNAGRRAHIRSFGFDNVIDPTAVDLQAHVLDETHGLGADVIIDAAGRPETAESTIELACHGGRILFFGVVAPGKRISVEPNRIFARELTVLGSIRNPFTHHRVMEILPSLGLDGIVTHRFALDDVNEAFAAARRGEGLKICIKPNG